MEHFLIIFLASNDSKALKNLADFILKEKLDLGAIFDGDADRISFVDEKGQFVEASTQF